MNAGPIVRAEVDLGDYTPVIEPDDPDWQPVTYRLVAHRAATLDPTADRVVERRLERLTLDLENDSTEFLEDPKPARLELPTTVEGIEALAQLVDAARDYLAQEATP